MPAPHHAEARLQPDSSDEPEVSGSLLETLSARKQLLVAAADIERNNLSLQIRELSAVLNPPRSESEQAGRGSVPSSWMSLISALWSGWSFFRRKPGAESAPSARPHWKDWLVALGQVGFSLWANSEGAKRRAAPRS